ncbi:hypothetical protein MXD62_16630 [Frankia sp. Mgl5]|uniref:hypothetical protein n=1 Tax=Frankia sp. Mgl5 TaxID=2933793 RepID=UPI00200D519E|nr:hypothetical protein [Frankia sp. Mgl5]MCK9928782.1 hypothetical protein [Frankia sp. Mgl5]
MKLLLVPVRSDALRAHRVTADVLGRHVLGFASAVARLAYDHPAPHGFVLAGALSTPEEVAAEATLVRAGLWRPDRVEGLGTGYYLDGWDTAISAMRQVGRG